MRRCIALLVALLVFVSGLMGNLTTVKAAEVDVEDTVISAYELCRSSNSWEEYKTVFQNFQCERGDFKGSVLKELPERLESLSSFSSYSIGGISDEEIDEFEEILNHAVSLYNEMGFLKLSVVKKDLEGPYSQIDIIPDDAKLTHLGNVVSSYNIPYYENVNAYFENKGACYYQKQILCYTCGVAYWNSDGTLEKIEYIPFDEVADLEDWQKPEIDTNFEGTTLILLCTTDTLLGWVDLDGLFQYEDAQGNMEFYNPDFISYYE